MVSVVKKYPRGAKNSDANIKLDASAARSLYLNIFSKKFCISDVEIAKSDAIVIISKKGAYKIYIQKSDVANSIATKKCCFIKR